MRSPTNVLVLALTGRAALLTRAPPRRSGRGLRFRFERVSATLSHASVCSISLMSYATPAQYIAELGAPDEASAIKKAIEEFTDHRAMKAVAPRCPATASTELKSASGWLTTRRVKAAAVPRS